MPCKCNKPVSRILCLPKADGNHSSRRFVTEPLKRPTRKRRPNCFGLTSGQPVKKRFSIWSCTARSLPSRACYQTRWRALTASFHPSPFGWSAFCCTCRHPTFFKVKCPDVIRLAALRCSDFPLSVFRKSDCPTCFIARLEYLNKKCSTNKIQFYCCIIC